MNHTLHITTKSLRTALALGVCLLGTAACDDPFEGDTFVTPTDEENEMSCTSVLEKHADEFSLWLELLNYADYYNGLKDADATATLFAPTNEAMEKFLEWRGVKSVEELDKQYAVYVVQNHIINGTKIGSETFVNTAVDGTAFPNKTLFQSDLIPTFGHQNTDVDDALRDTTIFDAETIYLNNQAAVQPRDSGGVNFIEASNAMIYYLDDVIHPLSETMIDKLEEQGEYTIFAAAARESGYDKVAELLRDTLRVAGGGYTVRTYSYTCFAPCDEAFRKEGINSLADLKSRVGEGQALYDFVAYHFLDRRVTRDDFFSFDDDDQVLIYDTYLNSEVVTCQNETDGTTLTPVINERAHVLRSNIEARNGLIHKIDYYLPVWQPDPVEVKWDFCNSSDIISFVNAYGADKGYGNLFSTALSNKEYQVDLSTNYRDGQYGELTSFTYKANTAKASYGNYRPVGFKKCKYTSTKDKTSNAYDAYMNNLLVLNLGYAGWVEFTTPTIIKGRYKVTLHYASEVSMKTFHSAGSLTKFEIDNGEEQSWTTNKYVFKGLPTSTYTYGSADLELFDEVDFETSRTHTFKGTMLDINAKTNGSYHQLWDYVIFTPIK
jgi:uncharacterized surface protein with fasciclin (FAS1) repeats